jgi:xanthine dehydrogenase YagR molybdenum-binding subunit
MSDRSVARYEAVQKVTGRAVYEGETPAENVLHAVLAEAPIASGAVIELDARAAADLPGFATLVTYDDAAPLKPSPATKLIQERTLHYAGQPVALVASDTLSAARDAARAVRIVTQARPAITAMAGAMDSAISPAAVGRHPSSSTRGNAAAALAGSGLVIRNRFETAANIHHPMEPHVVVCWWDGGRAVVHTSTQAVVGTRAMIAHAFQMPAADVRVVSRLLGGGFGCKGQLWWPWLFWAMLASRKAGRPVRLELTRAQMFRLIGRRQETVHELALGLDANGRLTAIEHHATAQTSTFADYSEPNAVYSRVLYACPNVTTSHKLVRTHEPQPVPMRAPGVAPGLFALETALDEAAERLGLDPVELRVRNFADHDQDTGRPWSSNSLLACYRVAAQRFGWSRRPAMGTAADGRWRIGWGMASTLYPATRQAAKVRVQIRADGGTLVQCGTQDMGSGTYTALGQIVAATLGVPAGSVTVELGDSLLPDGPFSGGSQVTASVFPAAEAATARLRAKVVAMAIADPASPLAQHAAANIVLAEGVVTARAGNIGEPLADILRRNAPEGIEAIGEVEATNHPSLAATSMGYGAIFAEVGVDVALGEIRVRRVTGAFAAGRILNPLLARSQYIGGLVGGIGMTLHERTSTDVATGRALGETLADYLIPVHADMPEFDIAMIEEDDAHLPGAIKGIGMLGTAGIQAAIGNAVYHATGKRVRRLPIRIEDILGQP